MDGTASDAVGLPESNGAEVAEIFDPIALTRSLNAAVLLVPSMIAGKIDITAPEAQASVTVGAAV